jgi:hypothetical protein
VEAAAGAEAAASPAAADVPAAGVAALAAALGDGTHTYTYDAENRLIKVDNGNTAIYTYDGEGHRASKTNNSGVNSGGNTPDPSGTVEFVYDSAGHLVHTESRTVGWVGEERCSPAIAIWLRTTVTRISATPIGLARNAVGFMSRTVRRCMFRT